jgi:hypothetical protein
MKQVDIQAKLFRMLDEAHWELEALQKKEKETIDSKTVPNNHWQSRWKTEQKIRVIKELIDALD